MQTAFIVKQMYEYTSCVEEALIEKAEREASALPMPLLRDMIEEQAAYVKQLSVSSLFSYIEGLKLILLLAIYKKRVEKET